MKSQAIVVLTLTAGLFGQQAKKTPAAAQSLPTAKKLSQSEMRNRIVTLVAAHKPAPITVPIAATPAKLKHQDVLLKLQKQKQTADFLRMTILASARNKVLRSSQATVAQGGPGGAIAPNGDAVNPDPAGLPGGKSGQRASAQTKTAAVTTIRAAQPAPTPRMSSVSPVANPSVAAVAVCHGPTISAVDSQASGAWFSPDSQYNPAIIQGCGFGDRQGSAHLYGPFTTSVVNLTVEFWSDTSIITAVNPNLSGELDYFGNVTLVVVPANAPQVQAKGFNFYAARAELQLTSIPPAQANLQHIADSAGQNTVTTNFYSPASSFPGATAQVDREDTGRFGSAKDSFSFDQLSPGFYLDKAQFWHFDMTQADCASWSGTPTLYVDGSWNAAWDGPTTLRVNTQEQHCHTDSYGSPFDTSTSDYAIAVWVNGPRGVDPWGIHPR